MGFEQKTQIQKSPTSELFWTGQKNLQRYDEQFEKYLKEETEHFYKQKSEQWNNMYSCFEYIKKVSEHLKKEEDNADFFLQHDTKPRILQIVLKVAVEDKAEALTMKESGCEYMFNERKIEELTMMYNVFSKVDWTLKFIINRMNPYINQEGGKIVKNQENLKDPLKFTQRLLDFKNEMDKLIEDAFSNDMKFQKNRDISFQNFMNECEKTPHFIAFYTDN